MQALTRKRPTDGTHVLVVACPENSFDNVLDYLKNNGCTVNDATCYEDECVSHEEVFPESSPGNRLRGLRWREDLTQAELAGRVGIPARHISEMENNKRPIGKKNARKLGDAFNIDPRVFLDV